MTESYRLPEKLETDRYVLRRVRVGDAQSIFDAYAADHDVTKYLAWRPHEDVRNTVEFLEAASMDWDVGASFASVAFHRDRPGDLLGSFEARVDGHCVNFGYVLKASAWKNGCAS